MQKCVAHGSDCDGEWVCGNEARCRVTEDGRLHYHAHCAFHGPQVYKREGFARPPARTPRRLVKCDPRKTLARLDRTYGVGAGEYKTARLEKSGGRCEICGAKPDRAMDLHLDHDHGKTGLESLRGVLCFTCNVMVSRLEGMYRPHMAYLRGFA